MALKTTQLRVWAAVPFLGDGAKAKVVKGGWRMPRLIQAMKDVISCDKPRVGANGP